MIFSWSCPKQLPIIIAHRGSSDSTPENTLAAFKKAIRDKADAVEFDIHLTKDKHIVVIHDNRLERTTSGRGNINEFSLSQLKKLSAGSWFKEKFASEKIPTLEESLSLLNGKVGINIEIKSDGNNFSIVDRCLEIVDKFSIKDGVLISSFNEKFLKRARILDSKIALGLLYNPLSHLLRSPIRLAQDLGVQYIILNGVNLRKKFVELSHNNGFFIGEYTINTKHRLERTLRFGVDAVITNRPAFIKKMIRRK